jgi:HJR/Mrr/RecB family endonuclease
MDYTKMFSQTFETLLLGTSFLFSFWFIIIFSPLTWRGKKSKLWAMFIIWFAIALIRAALFLSNQKPMMEFIPEPLSTELFVASGPILLIASILQRRWKNKNFQKKANSLHQIEDFLKLSPSDFEAMIIELYVRAGHKAKRTGATGDHGVDIVVEAKNGEKWVVQCKRWKGSVGEPIVRDFYGVVQHEKADKGILFSTGRYTAPAQEWAKGKPITLYDGNKLVDIWSRSKTQPHQTQQTASNPINS